MPENKPTMAQQVAQAVRAFQQQITGHSPALVTAALSGNTLVVTMNDALTPAEKALAQSAVGHAQVQELHRQLFAHNVATLRQEIKRITGVEVREAATEMETKIGAIVHAFTDGTMIQVFRLATDLPEVIWNGTSPQP